MPNVIYAALTSCIPPGPILPSYGSTYWPWTFVALGIWLFSGYMTQ